MTKDWLADALPKCCVSLDQALDMAREDTPPPDGCSVLYIKCESLEGEAQASILQWALRHKIGFCNMPSESIETLKAHGIYCE